ncbi:MAG: GAF domain-containing protein, partial [Gammaproteobacteria bacterium]|nr:GAF domain-containing protein [Gammaproteobacteria bacterium]
MAIEAELALHHLRKGGIACAWLRVETEAELRAALRDFRPSIILSDFSLPQFDGMSALAITRELAPDVPFIFVSGTIGEERAIEALRRGAVDYVLKSNLSRLAPAVGRALEQNAVLLERRRQEAQISRMTRVLRMLSGINGVMLRIHDRNELLAEACRLAVSIGGYASAIVLLKNHGQTGIRPIAWTGRCAEATELLRTTLAESGQREASLVGRVLQNGRPFVCNDTSELAAGHDDDASTITAASTSGLMTLAGFRSLVALPLLIDKTALGVFLLTATD